MEGDHGFFWMIYELIYSALDSHLHFSGPAAPEPPEEQNGEADLGEDGPENSPRKPEAHETESAGL